MKKLQKIILFILMIFGGNAGADSGVPNMNSIIGDDEREVWAHTAPPAKWEYYANYIQHLSDDVEYQRLMWGHYERFLGIDSPNSMKWIRSLNIYLSKSGAQSERVTRIYTELTSLEPAERQARIEWLKKRHAQIVEKKNAQKIREALGR